MKAEKGTRVDSYGTLNEVLVNLFRDVMEIEQRALESSEFQDLTNNDMHVIEAIGMGAPKNMSSIARQLHVTTGTLTIAMNSLVKKGYVKRERSEQDRRVVYIMLTSKGKLAYRHHEAFHRKMTEALVENLSQEDTELLVRAMTNLKNFLKVIGKTNQNHRENKSETDEKTVEINDAVCPERMPGRRHC